MTRYQINTTAQAIYPDGRQPALSILNEGPSTVYLDGVSSVSLESFELAPNSTMTWKANEPLWALTRVGTAHLNVNVYGGLSITNTRQFDNLYTETFPTGNQFQATQYVETSTYDALSLSISVPDAPAIILGGAINVELFWYAEDGTSLAPEFSRFWLAQTPLYVTTPVKGSFAYVIVTTTYDVTPTLTVLGTTRALSHAMQYYPPIYSQAPAGSGEDVSWGRGVVAVHNWSKKNLFLPAWGNILDVTVFDTSSADHSVVLSDNYDPATSYGIIDITPSPPRVFSKTLYVPRSRGIVLGESTDVWPEQVNITFTWRDYQ